MPQREPRADNKSLTACTISEKKFPASDLLHKDAFSGMNRSSFLAKADQFIRVAAPEIFRSEA
jgi:hypothetical protein